MAAVTAVGVDDNFAASETGVAHGPADDEAAGWVDVILGVFVEHSRWYDWLDDVFENGVAQIVVGNGFTMLGRNDDGVHADGLAVTIFDRDLGLAVGPEKINFSGFANFGELEGELVGELDGHRHQLGRFIAGETEHQALIAGAAGIHAHGDIRGLALDGAHDGAGFGIIAELGAVVADAANSAAN